MYSRNLISLKLINEKEIVMAIVIRKGVFDIQVCVPEIWTDEQVIDFAEENNPCGTTNGWSIRKQGDKALAGDNERVTCEIDEDHVHIMLDA